MNTIIKTIIPKDPYARIPRTTLQDPKLGLKARGLLAYLLSKPEDWVIRIPNLAKDLEVGTTAIYSALKRLRELGYAKLESVRKEGGKYATSQWTVDVYPNLGEGHGIAENGMPFNGMPFSATLTNKRVIQTKEKHIVRNDVRYAHANSGQKGFFKNGEGINPFIIKCVATLETYVRQARQISLNFKRSNWVKEFILLLHSLDGNEERLETVLNFYVKEPAPFKPEAYCAQSFRNKFLQIESWCVKRGFIGPYQPPRRKIRLIEEE